MFRALHLFLVTSLLAPSALSAQTHAAGGVIDGVVSTQGGTVRLGGVQVTVRDARGQDVATALGDGDGHFRLVALPDGTYRVVAVLAGFEATTAAVVVTEGKTPGLAPSDAISGPELDEYAPGGGLQAALRLLASIIEVPRGVKIKGGRPSQVRFERSPWI